MFTLRDRHDFNPRWMARVPESTPEQSLSANDVLRKQHDEGAIGPVRVVSRPADEDDGGHAVTESEDFYES